MTKRIYKYKLDHSFASAASISVEMVIGAKILAVQIQNNQICIWALIDTNNEDQLSRRDFQLIGTGHDIDDMDQNLEYIGTCQFNLRTPLELVLHVFEIVEIVEIR